ncbi:exodeoxyribonuclease III [Parvibium lacunae]|uniref:Exodeoxyribonuclease III n=1 Tax=Parvibium lacunae TaxID=1888893 RepID=A0A368L861_9BURK|nr:exodeoxyribonuclease III [Parvibium lacunae]RCS59843.1 exodeoxyribonuclease III [Parvibium lacunae]
MQIATWNVNSLNVRLPHVLGWLAENPVDFLCLQELKMVDEKFPLAALQEAGYDAVFAGQKTYNGVAILRRIARTPAAVATQINLPTFADEQKRVIAATYGDVRVICAYFPNGQAVGSEKFAYKMAWLAGLQTWLQAELTQYPKMVFVGDFNIAPDDRDVYDPVEWAGQIHCSEEERTAFKNLLALPLHDAFRHLEAGDKHYSWWDYRQMAFRRNRGLRIDHILVSDALLPHVSRCWIDKTPRKLEQPSDHTPVIVEIN